MNMVDYNEVYKAKFGEYLPLMMYYGEPEEKVVSIMQKAVATGKPIDIDKLTEETPEYDFI